MDVNTLLPFPKQLSKNTNTTLAFKNLNHNSTIHTYILTEKCGDIHYRSEEKRRTFSFSNQYKPINIRE